MFSKCLVVTPVAGVAQWCNHLTLQAEQSSGVGSSTSRAPPLERHEMESRTRLWQLHLHATYMCVSSVFGCLVGVFVLLEVLVVPNFISFL